MRVRKTIFHAPYWATQSLAAVQTVPILYNMRLWLIRYAKDLLGKRYQVAHLRLIVAGHVSAGIAMGPYF